MQSLLPLLLAVLAAVVLGAVVAERSGAQEPEVVAVEVLPPGVRALPGLGAAAADELALVDAWFSTQHPNASGLRWRRDEAGRIAVPTLALPAEGTGTVLDASGVGAEVRAAGLAGVDDVVLAFVDVTVADTCGQAVGEDGGVTTVVWMRSCGDHPDPASTALPDGATYVVAHELAHAMGAAPACAPNASLLGHVTDDRDDVLFVGRGRYRAPEPVLDVGNDDYFLTFRDDCPDLAQHPLWVRDP